VFKYEVTEVEEEEEEEEEEESFLGTSTGSEVGSLTKAVEPEVSAKVGFTSWSINFSVGWPFGSSLRTSLNAQSKFSNRGEWGERIE